MPTVALIYYEHRLQNLRDQMCKFQHSKNEFEAVEKPSDWPSDWMTNYVLD